MVKFSILVPVYNVKKFLCQCLDSIVEQTYRNLEIICIDDGSTDGSEDILDAYAQKDERIRVEHKKNAGYGHSLNMGLEMACGEYIGIVESDDYIAPDMYERFAHILAREEKVLDVVKAMYYRVSQNGCEVQRKFEAGMCGRVISPKDYPGLFALPCSIWTAVYRRDFLDKNGIRFLETPGASYQDTAFCFKVWATAEHILLTNDPVLFYRVDNDASSINSGGKLFCVCDEIREIEHYMDSNNLHIPFLEGVKGVYIYRTYIWNYYRLHIGLRSAFWVEMIRKFQSMAQSAGFCKAYWNDEDWEQINLILKDPEKFLWNSISELKSLELDQYTVKNEVYLQFLTEYLQRQERIAIYGAGMYGKLLWEFLKRQGLQTRVLGFIVTDRMDNPDFIEDRQVYSIEEIVGHSEDVCVIVAVSEGKQKRILGRLKGLGFTKVIRVENMILQYVRGVIDD